MRAFLLAPFLLAGTGCHTPCFTFCHPCCESGPSCSRGEGETRPTRSTPTCPEAPCEAPCEAPKPRAPEAPCEASKRQPPCPPAAPCPAPRVEVKPAEEVHVTAPPQKVIVNAPAPAAALPQSVVPQSLPGVVPQAIASVPVMLQSAPQNNVVATSVQTTTAPRARVAVGLGWVRIPFPVPRLYAIPGPQRVTTETEYATVAAPQVAVAAPASLAAVQQVQLAAQPTVALASAVQPAAVPAAVPTSVTAAPQVAVAATPVYLQAQCSPQAAAVPSSAPAACATGSAQVSKATVEELTRQLQAVQQLLDAREQARQQSAGPPGISK